MAQHNQAATSKGLTAALSIAGAIEPSKPTRLVYHLADPATGSPVTDVVDSHERPMHLIIVSRDLLHFQHLHPAPSGAAGEYTIEATFPEPNTYLLYAEFTRAGGHPTVERHEVAVGDDRGHPASLAEDRAPKVIGDVQVSLQGADALRAGPVAALAIRIVDAQAGSAITNLRPYLGAPAHIVIIDERGQTFGHAHGEQLDGSTGIETRSAPGDGHGIHGAAAAYGPDIGLHHTFQTPGLYKIWAQMQLADGDVITASFVVRAY